MDKYAILLNLIFSEYFTSRCTFMITDAEHDHILHYFQNQIVNIRIGNNRLDYTKVLDTYGCQQIIIHTNDSPGTFRQFENIIRNTSNVDERFNGRRYVIFLDKRENQINSVCNELQYVSDVLFIEEETGSLNVNNTRKKLHSTILKEDNAVFILSTHRFVGNENVEDMIYIDKWFSDNGSFLFNQNLFPDKISNLQGKTLRLVSVNYHPFSVFDDENHIYDGVEAILCKEYAIRRNATLAYITTDDWGNVYKNWTGYGIFGILAENRADIGFGALYRWMKAWPYLDFSTALTRSGIRLYVPGPRLAGGWFQPTYSYSPTVWKVAVFTFFFCSAFLFIILIHYDLHRIKGSIESSKNNDYISMYTKTLFTTMRIFLEQPITKVSEERVFKMFVFFIIIQTLLLSFFYNSGYASIMTIPRYKGMIKTIQDFADSGLNWGAPTDIWIQALSTTDDEKYRTVVKHYVVAGLEDIIEFGKQRIFGYPLERLQFGHFALLEYHTKEMAPDYRITIEDLNWDFCIYMTKKHSIYLPTLNQLISRIFESGIVASWENNVVAKYMDSSIQNLMNYYYEHYEVKKGVIKLSWKHIQGAFGILMIGYLASSVCFMLELIVYHYQMRRHSVRSRELV